jgi:hypothetical protein
MRNSVGGIGMPFDSYRMTRCEEWRQRANLSG